MRIRKKILLILLSLTTIFGILSISSCQSDTNDIAENIQVSSIPECLSSIEEKQENAKIHNSELVVHYNTDIKSIKSYVQSLSNENLTNEELENKLTVCIQDVISVTKHFEKLDVEFDTYAQKLSSCDSSYEIKLNNIENEFNIAYENYPNYYNGTETQYKSERSTWLNKIFSAKKSYDLAMRDIKAASEATGLPQSVLSTQYYNKYLADVPYYENQIKALDTAWSQTQILNEIATRYTKMENEYNSVRQKILNEFEALCKNYADELIDIETKYNK